MLGKLADLLAVGIYIVKFFKSHKTIKNILLYGFLASLTGYLVWGDVFLSILGVVFGLAFQLLFAISFMVIQFGALFYFLSQSKTTIIVPGDKKKYSLADYKGQPELTKTMTEWIDLISNQTKFIEMGGRYIKGILLFGVPGSGKTYMAKCLAQESNCAFMGVEGSGFKGIFFGMDVMKLLFTFSKARKLAKEYKRCILFIDEIDALGAARGGQAGGMGGGMFGGGGGAITRLLVELDGIGEFSQWDASRNQARSWFKLPELDNGTLLVIGSTNLRNVLDPALTRSGRLDKLIEVNLPDKSGRLEIIKYYLSKVKNNLGDVELEYLSNITGFLTPATIEASITTDAVRLALFSNREYIVLGDIENAMQDAAFGLKNPISDLSSDQRWSLSVHEASHAIAQHFLLGTSSKIVTVTIVRRANYLGYMLPIDSYDRYVYPLEDIEKRIVISLAGHVGVKLVRGEYYTGATGDFEHVRQSIAYLHAHNQFGKFAMSDAKDSPEIDKFYKKMLKQTEKLLLLEIDLLLKVATALKEKQTLTGQEFYAIVGDKE